MRMLFWTFIVQDVVRLLGLLVTAGRALAWPMLLALGLFCHFFFLHFIVFNGQFRWRYVTLGTTTTPHESLFVKRQASSFSDNEKPMHESCGLPCFFSFSLGSCDANAFPFVLFSLEDLSVLVIELGSNWIKAGYAGEEGPRLVLPGHIGSIEAYEAEAAQSSHKATAIKVSPSSYKSYFIGDMNVSHARPLMNIKPFLKDDTGKHANIIPVPWPT